MSQKLKKQLISELTKETLESSSIHAIPNITKNKFYSIKTIWFLFFLISSGFCFWFIIQSITDYLNYDVVSKTKVNFETEIIFPVINVCNLNTYKTQTINNKIKEYLQTNFPKMSLKFQSQVITKSYSLNETISQAYFNSELSPSKFITSCTFNSITCDLNKDFEYYFDFSYGYCFRYNSGRSLNGSKTERKFVTQNGISYGLQLDLLIASSARENDYLFSSDNGYNIIITDDPQSESLYSEGVSVPAGFHTKISLNRYMMKKQPKPYSECIKDLTKIDSYNSECYRKSFDPTRNYHYADCVNLCFQKMLASECKCQNLIFRYNYDNKLRICIMDMKSLVNDSLCIYNSYLKFSKNTEYAKECDCPIECDKTFYQILSSISDYPTRQMSKYLLNNTLLRSKFQNRSYTSISYDEVRESVARISIFYNEMKQTVLSEEIKTTMNSLISNIGGTLGLFLGKTQYLTISFILFIYLI